MRIDRRDVVGPNAIIQTALAVRDIAGSLAERDVFHRAGLGSYLLRRPDAMVPEQDVASLFATLVSRLPDGVASQVLDEAGRRTADYIVANRMPAAVAQVLAVLPIGLSARILLTAIRQHAWTFAGSGAARISLSVPLVLEIHRNPLAIASCRWHVAILRRLFHKLVGPEFEVAHPICCAAGGAHCRFEIARAQLECAQDRIAVQVDCPTREVAPLGDRG